jgi:thymidylate synthase
MKQLKTGELEFNSFENASLYFAKLLKKGTPLKSTNEKNLETYKKEIVELQNVNYSIPMGKILSDNEFHKPAPFWAISESLSEILNLPRPIMERYKPDLMNWSYSMTSDRMPCYSYGERLHNYNQIMNVFNRLKNNPTSKKAFLSIYQGYDTELTRPDIPCTLGWMLNIRDNKLDITTIMRSWDFFAGQIYDAFLANLIGQSYVSWLKNDGNENLKPGKIHFFGGSLHYYPSKSSDMLENMIKKGETFFYNDVEPFSINSNMEDYFKDLHNLEDAEQAVYNGNFSYADDKLKKISIPIFRDFTRVYMIRNAKTYKNAFLEKKYRDELESEEMKKWMK